MNSLILTAIMLAQGGPSSLDLSGWVSLALSNSPDMLEAGAAVSQAEARVQTVRSALLPSLVFGASAGHAWSTVEPVGDYESDSYNASLTLSQELLASGGRSWLDLSASRLSRDAVRSDFEASRLQLELDVAQAFYDVVGSMGLVSSAEAALERSSRQLERIQALYDLGAATSLELVQAQVGESGDRLSLARRQQGLRTSYASLYSAAGVGAGEDLPTVDTSAVLPPLTIEAARGLDLDLSANPSLRSADIRSESALKSLSSARRAYWPSLSASGSWSWNSEDLDIPDAPNEDSWNVRLSLSWPIFDGWMRESAISSASASVLSGQASKRSLENQLSASLSNSKDALVTSIESYDLASLSLDYSRRRLELSQMNYELGGLTLIDLLDAQAALAEAEAALVTARVDCLKAEAVLMVLAGRSPRLGE